MNVKSRYGKLLLDQLIRKIQEDILGIFCDY